MFNSIPSSARVLALVLALPFTAAVAFADDSAAKTPPDDPAVTPAAPAPSFFSHFAVHGYFTQGYADADQHQILGITRNGTAQYRAAALQLRYTATPHDSVVVQVAHEKEGNTLIKDDNIEFDWGFYRHTFGDGTTVKLGRVQLPYGIYNELRDVGTLLPFYRIASNYYGEGAYTNEALDGVTLMHRFSLPRQWSLEATGFYGRWSVTQVRDNSSTESDVKGAFGTQLWLNTPVDGVRVGAFASRYKMEGGFASSGNEDLEKTFAGSLDATVGRFTARAEASRINDPSGHTTAWYAELAARVHPKLSLNVLTDRRHLVADVGMGGTLDIDIGVDNAFGVAYYIRPDFVFKAETHRNRSLLIEDAPVNPFAALPRADYVILSLTASF